MTDIQQKLEAAKTMGQMMELVASLENEDQRRELIVEYAKQYFPNAPSQAVENIKFGIDYNYGGSPKGDQLKEDYAFLWSAK